MRGAGRLPIAVRRRLAEHRTVSVDGGPLAAGRTVVIVSHELTATGAPKLMAEMAIACREAGWSVIVVAPERGHYLNLAGPGLAIVVHPDALDQASPAATLAAGADAVICNTISCTRLVEHLPAGRTVWSLHETGLIDAFRQALPATAQGLRSVAEVWASSALVAAHVPERPDAHVIGAAVAPIAPARGAAGPQVRALVLGSLEARKGQHLAVAARALLPAELRDALRIDFHGGVREPAFAAELRRLTDGDPGLHLGDEIAPDAAAGRIAAADLVLVPSRDEPLSLVAIEAMSAGAVVVCSRAAGIAGYLEDGRSAFIADAATPESLAAALERCLRARSDWPAIAAEARAIYDACFTPERFRAACRARLAAVMDAADQAGAGAPTAIGAGSPRA